MASPLNNADVTRISEHARQRIAHDLHDGLGQLLGGIALKLQALHETLAEKEHPESADTAHLVALVNEAIAQTRLLARGLDPVIPATASLSSALVKLAADTMRLFRGVSCTFSAITAPHTESPVTAEHLFRIAQEAINNAIRHGRATQILLELGADDREVTLAIRDNGKGAARIGEPASGIGLRIMRHRAEAIGGTLEIGPGTEGGTVVLCRAPLRPAA